ncbi:MAG: extracellular solute-binding protein [Chloroflexi bacterium]|nr:extracellular solute-binding protein [Chloroflexota bacterium]
MVGVSIRASDTATTRRTHLTLSAALAGFGGISLAACGAPSAGEAPKGKLSDTPVSIAFFKRGTLSEPDIEVMLKDWYAKHPTWKVEFTQPVNNLEKLTPYVATGEKIDLLGWYQTVRGLILNTGIPRAIDDFVKRDKYPVQQFSAKEVDLIGRSDGKLFALPYAYGGNLTATFYNRALFKQAGVPEPPTDWNKAWTWDEFRTNLRKLTKKGGSTISQVGITHYGDPITSLLVHSDAKWITDDWKKATADSPELLQTLERWADVAKDGSTMASPGVDLGTTNTREAFMTGRAAMYTICCGPAADGRRFNEAGMDWGFAPSPKMKYTSPDMQSNTVLLTKLGAYPEHAWELLKYLIEDNRWGNAEARLPAVLEDAHKWVKEVFRNSPNVRPEVVADGVKFARTVDKVKYHPAGDEIYKVVQPVLKDIWAGKATVRTAIPPLQSQIQALMDRTPMG